MLFNSFNLNSFRLQSTGQGEAAQPQGRGKEQVPQRQEAVHVTGATQGQGAQDQRQSVERLFRFLSWETLNNGIWNINNPTLNILRV